MTCHWAGHLAVEELIYLYREGSQHGPFTAGQVREMWTAGQLLGTDYFCREGGAGWEDANTFLAGLPKPQAAPKADARVATPSFKAKPRKAQGKPDKMPAAAKPARSFPLKPVLAGVLGLLLVGGVAWWFLGGSTEVKLESLSQREGLFYAPGESKPFDGVAVGYHADGGKREERYFADGLPNGPSTAWHENGVKQAEGMMKDGQYDGAWTTWHANGERQSEYVYEDGKEVSRQEWDEEGNPLP